MRKSISLVGLMAFLLLAGDSVGRAETPAPSAEVTCPEGAMIVQPPNMGGDGWEFYASDSGPGFLRYEKFQGASGPICGVRWWGLNKFDSGSGFAACQENPMGFHIVFYQDDQGKPGAPVSSYTVTVTGAGAGEVEGDTVYAYEANLEPCCTLTAGWVSIEGFGGSSSCWFTWISSSAGDGSACLKNPMGGLICATGQHFRDLSLCLTNAPVEVGIIDWGAVQSRYR